MLFGKKSNELVEDQIKILSTNVEALNQRLVQEPTSAGTESSSGQKNAEILEQFRQASEVQKARQNELKEIMVNQLTQLNSRLAGFQSTFSTFARDREQFSMTMDKFADVVSELGKFNGAMQKDLVKQLTTFNSSAYYLNQNIVEYRKEIDDLLNQRLHEIGESVANKLVRTTTYFIIGIVVLSIILSLLFVKLFMG
jgi:hypothetical protein